MQLENLFKKISEVTTDADGFVDKTQTRYA